ncbi:MAG: DNA gyrase inhibitor YacG [Kofleriaceae bacterium]
MKRTCPICRRDAIKADNKFWPLCSERCQLVDLGKWLGEEYRVAEPLDGSPAARDPSEES